MHVLKPRLSEKAFGMSQATNTFAIDVPTELNKFEVADAVEKQFDVKVARVRLINRKGKAKRVMNLTGKRTSNQHGTQNAIKKAYVTLKPGSHLPFFAAAEEEIAKAEEAEKKAKKKAEKKAEPKAEKTAAKKATKETK
jgi:large subunit ribosomal protein L23